MRRSPARALWLAGAAAATLAGETFARDAVAVDLAPRSITVGDPVEARVVVDAAVEPRFPDWSRGWGEAEVLEIAPVERLVEGGRTRFAQKLKLTAFRTGKVDLPPLVVRLADGPDRELATPAGLALEVRSVLPADPGQAAPMPAEPPRPLPVPRAAFWTIGLLALAVVAAALATRRRSTAATAAARPELPPWPELEATLGALAGAEPAAGHARLSSALRRYLGRALGFPALESTTREIERALAGRRLEPALATRAGRLLRETDQVKFARRGANAAELERRRQEALEVGAAVEAHLHPAPAVEEGAA